MTTSPRTGRRPAWWCRGLVLLSVPFLVALVACSRDRDVTGPTSGLVAPPPSDSSTRLASVEVTRYFPSLFAGDTLRLFATARSADGTDLRLSRAAVWTSDRPEVARVDDKGIVTAIAPGKAVIHAKIRGMRGAQEVVVLTPRIRPTREISYIADSVNALGEVSFTYAAVKRIDQPTRRVVSNLRSFADGLLWSPDGEALIVQYHDVLHWGAFLTTLDGSGEREIGMYLYGAQWSPDSRHITYHWGTVPGDETDLQIRNADGSDPHEIMRAPNHQTFPLWSPDGRQILFFGSEGPPGPLGLIAADGTRWRRFNVGNTTFGAVDPAWSPDGKQVAYSDGAHIWLANSDGSDPRILLGTCAYWPCSGITTFRSPSWSPDGKWIAFMSGLNFFHRIGVVGRDGRDAHFVTPGTCCALSVSDYAQQPPAWSPDGELIAYDAIAPDGRSVIAVVRPDGTGRRAVTGAPESAHQPAWRP